MPRGGGDASPRRPGPDRSASHPYQNQICTPPGNGGRRLRFALSGGGRTLGFMLRQRVMAFGGVMLWLALAVGGGGCAPEGVHLSEERDPHFQRGRDLVNSQDFKGAVAEFELTTENNPRSAAAHFELGWLYES